MIMKILFVFVSVLYLSECKSARRLRLKRQVSSFQFHDCGRPNKAIHFQRMSVSPDPITIPGKLLINFQAENKKPLPNADIKAKVLSEGWLGNFTVPCMMEFGSCTYSNICELMNEQRDKVEDALRKHRTQNQHVVTEDKTAPILKKLIDAMDHSGAPKQCPIPRSSVQINDLEIEITDDMIPPLVKSVMQMADGTYYIEYKILEHNRHHNELGCLQIKASLQTVAEEEEKDACDGWFCW